MKKTTFAALALVLTMQGGMHALKAQEQKSVMNNRLLVEKSIYQAPVIENPSHAKFKEILKTNKLVLVELGLESCGPCLKFKRAVKELFSKDKRASELTFVYFDISTSDGKKIFTEYQDSRERTVPRVFLVMDGDVDKTKDYFGVPSSPFYWDSIKVSEMGSYGYANLFKREFDITLTTGDEQAFSGKLREIANSAPIGNGGNFVFKGIKFSVLHKEKDLLEFVCNCSGTPAENFVVKKSFFEWIDLEVKKRTQVGQ